MALKDRFRRAIGRNDRSSSNSSSSTANPVPTPPITAEGSSTPTPSNPPAITLTKTSSRLSKSLTWTSRKNKPSKEEKDKKRLEEWEKKDEEEWKEPKTKYPERKSKAHQDMLRAFEWKLPGRNSLEGGRPGEVRKRWSGWSGMSGVSPGTSRMNSVEGDGLGVRRGGSVGSVGGMKRGSGGGLSREVTRTESGGQGMVGTVEEE